MNGFEFDDVYVVNIHYIESDCSHMPMHLSRIFALFVAIAGLCAPFHFSPLHAQQIPASSSSNAALPQASATTVAIVAPNPANRMASYSLNLQTPVQAVTYDPRSAMDPNAIDPNPWNEQVRLMQAGDALANPTSAAQKQLNAQRLESKLQYRAAQGFNHAAPDHDPVNANPQDGPADRSNVSGLSHVPKVGVEMGSTYTWGGASAVPDGACAVSGNGYIVTTNNTHVQFYDDQGNTLYEEGEDTFWSALTPTGNIFDPRVVYDTYNNRFIIVVLHGSSSTTTQMYVAFSQSSNPLNGWNFYSINTNNSQTGSWLDYPHIGYTEDNLIVAGNLFVDGENFSDISRVFMFDLDDGYNGDAINWGTFTDIEYPTWGVSAYTLCPLSFPYGNYGPGAYLLNRKGDDELGLWYITGNLASDPTMDAYTYDTPQRDYPVAAPQANVTNTLDVGSKIQHCFYMGEGRLYYSYTASDSDGDNRIVVGMLDINTGDVEDKSFGLSGWDYAYPWPLPWAADIGSWDGELVVPFLSVSSTTNPQFRVATLGADWEWSGSTSIKFGESAIDFSTGQNRWGDYLGGWVRENAGQPEVWVYGQYGKNNDHTMWTAQVLEDVLGCTDTMACNFDANATADDGSCQYTTCAGCTDAEACNYASGATIDDGSCSYPGCTSFGACNYSFSAGCDDGSCCFGHCIEMTMESISIFPPGNYGSFSIINNATDEVVLSGPNLATNYSTCLENGCYTLAVSGDVDMDWSLATDPFYQMIGFDYTIFSGTGPFTDQFILGDGGEAGGCTEAEACNFDPAALCDNGSCCYDHCVTLEMTDSFGDGWNGNQWKIQTPDGENTLAIGTLEGGAVGEAIACLEDGCYMIIIDILNGQYPFEVAWTLSGINDGPISGVYNTPQTFSVGTSGSNVGCTDAMACNYDVEAYCDDGSCCYSNCATLTMEDSFGDGWNGSTIALTDQNGLGEPMGMETGSFQTLDVCLVDGCYQIDVTAGFYPMEISWTLMFSNYLVGGGAPFSQGFSLNALLGCMEPAACNYDAAATCDDGSCAVSACGDPAACNYSGGGICLDDLLCDYGCYGCTYESALNFEPSATLDDGSCVFLTPSSCVTDVNWDGMVSINDMLLLLSDFGSTCE